MSGPGIARINLADRFIAQARCSPQHDTATAWQYMNETVGLRLAGHRGIAERCGTR